LYSIYLGALLLDEMALSSAISFNKSTLKVDGLVDLGVYTPEKQLNQMGDHALVFMFQPFRVPWVQSIGAFLSEGAANAEVLQKLILEAIILLEKAGLHVHIVVTDGGAWNRGMWKLFGIDEDNVGCTHPVNQNRNLWFASDFFHLIKTTWSRVLKQQILEVKVVCDKLPLTYFVMCCVLLEFFNEYFYLDTRWYC